MNNDQTVFEQFTRNASKSSAEGNLLILLKSKIYKSKIILKISSCVSKLCDLQNCENDGSSAHLMKG